MAEPKYRYRLPPCPAYDIPAMESWLEDMAAKGLHLSADGFFMGFATFEEGPPRRERFRLEPTPTQKGLFSEEYDPELDAIEIHRQMGWVYRARRDQFHIYSAADPDAPELNTDPQVQAITMEALTKYLRKSLTNTLILAVFYALLYFGDALISGSIYLGTWRVALLAGLLLWDLGPQIRALAVLTRCRKQLQNGQPLPHRSDYRQQNIRYLISNGARKVLWVFLAVSLTAYLLPIMTDEPYVPLEDQQFPFTTLEDLYPGAEVDRQNGILVSEVYAWSDLLAPECYDFTEYAEITRDGQSFDCYLTVTYHRTRWEWTARMLAREFASQSGANLPEQLLDRLFGNGPTVLTELALPDADYCAYYYKNLPDPYLILQHNDVVLRVRYGALGKAPRFEPEELARIVLSQIQ